MNSMRSLVEEFKHTKHLYITQTSYDLFSRINKSPSTIKLRDFTKEFI